MTCYFSKWIEVFAIPDIRAQSIAVAIYVAYCRHGAWTNIITNQGRELGIAKIHWCLLCDIIIIVLFPQLNEVCSPNLVCASELQHTTPSQMG